ncbi:MAG: enoyl-CoA hydratase [Pseudomonadota bacterium]
MSIDSPVLRTDHDRVCTLTLNRPKALNALSTALRNALIQTFDSLRSDPAVDVVILTGAGRAFTVGLDLKELAGEREATESADTRDLAQLMMAIPQPIIAAVNGFAITGGFELALLCDFIIASPSAQFADTHARVGVVPGWGLSQRLPRLIGINRAKELSLTGNYLDAATAERWGLVNRVVPEDELLPTCERLARDMLSADPTTRQAIRRIMDEGWMTTLDSGLALERAANADHDQTRKPSEDLAGRRGAIFERGRTQSS